MALITMVALDGERSRQVEVLWGCDGDNSKESNSLFRSTHMCWTALASWEVVSEAEFIEREY